MDTNHDHEITARRRGWIACLAVLLATCLALAALLASPAAALAKVQSFKAAKVKRGVATFRMKGVSAGEIRAARVVSRQGTKRVALGRARRGARRGRLRVRITRRTHHSRRARHKLSRSRRAHDARRKKRPRTTQPAPTGTPAAPTSPVPAPQPPAVPTLVLETSPPGGPGGAGPGGGAQGSVSEWPSVGSPPLGDAAAAARVTPRAESRPANAGANHYMPGSAELAAFHSLADRHNPLSRYVSGGFAGTTDEILQWAAYKWGFRPDVMRAVAHTESRWDQQGLGDRRDGVNAALYPPLSRIDSDSAYESLGITQIKWRPDGSMGPGTEPLRWRSTAFNADYWGAGVRYYYDGLCNWCGSGYSAGQGWESIGAHFSPIPWRNPGQLDYVNRIKGVLAAPTW